MGLHVTEDQVADGLIERKEERGWWAFSQ